MIPCPVIELVKPLSSYLTNLPPAAETKEGVVRNEAALEMIQDLILRFVAVTHGAHLLVARPDLFVRAIGCGRAASDFAGGAKRPPHSRCAGLTRLCRIDSDGRGRYGGLVVTSTYKGGLIGPQLRASTEHSFIVRASTTSQWVDGLPLTCGRPARAF